jgi:hypothetical protein
MKADLKGLGALLLDDSTCRIGLQSIEHTYTFHVSDVPEILEDSVSKILESRGIKYSHQNDDILVPNTIEEQQMRKARKVRVLGFVRVRRAILIVFEQQ